MLNKLCAILIVLFAASPLFAAFEGEMRLLNQQLNNDVLTVDVYLKSTGDDPLYLSDCNYTFEINHKKFSNMKVSFTPGAGLLTDRYSYTTTVLADNTIAVDVFASEPRSSWSLSRFQSRIALISDQGNGTLLGSLKIETLTNFSGYSGLDLRTTFPFFTNINSYDDESPYQSGEVDVTFIETPAFPLAPIFNVNIVNPRLQGNDVLVDVELSQTDGPDFYLSDSDVNIQLNAAQFDSPTAEVVEVGGSKLSGYTVTPSFVNGLLKLKLDAPATAGQAELDSKLEKVTRAPGTTKIATVRVRDLKTTVGFRKLALAWANGVNASVWKRRRPVDPWSIEDDISANATTNAAAPVSTLSLSAPAEAGQYCFGDQIAISWQFLHVRAVNIELRPAAGGAATSIVNNRPAAQTPYNWSLPDLAGGNYRIAVIDAADGTLASLSPVLTLGKAADILSSSGEQALCIPENAEAVFSVEIDGQPLPQITWQKQATGQDWTNLEETSTELRLPNRKLDEDGTRYRAIVQNFCGRDTSAAMLMTVKQTPRVLAPPVDLDRCTGDNAIFNVQVNGVPQPALQWQEYVNDAWVDIAGQTEASYRFGDVRFADSGRRFRVMAVNECGTIFSPEARLHVDDPARVTLQPEEVVVLCEGGDFSFSAEVTGSPAPELQWERSTDGGLSWENIAGATGLSISGSDVDRTMSQYRYRLILRQEACVGEVRSRDARIVVNHVPDILLQPKDVTVCENQPTAFTAEAKTRPAVMARWQRRKAGEDNWEELAYRGPTLKIDQAGLDLHGARYRAVYDNSCGEAVATQAATLNVNFAPRITTEPEDVTVCQGGSTLFSAGADARPAATLQWELSADDGETWLKLPAADGNIYELANVRLNQHGQLYRASFVNSCSAERVYTRAARMNVVAIPRVTRQPFSVRALVGETVQLSVEVVPPDVNYSWHRNGVPMITTERISGVKSHTLIIDNVQPEDVGARYQLVIDGQCGRDSSQFAAVNVDVPGIEILGQPAQTESCAGESVSFRVQAISTITGTTLEYQWRRGEDELSNGGAYSGVNSSELIINPTGENTAASDYNVQITVQPGGATTFSDNAALVIVAAPEVLNTSPDVEVCAGESRVLEVGAEGEELRYQWMFNEEPIAGATDSQLQLNNLDEAAAGVYRCIVRNRCGATESDEITVSLKTATRILVGPADVQTNNESEFTLSVEAEGSGELTYQWFKDGEEIPGAVQSTYTKVFPDEEDEGEYSVRVTGECDAATSDPAVVSVTIVGIDEVVNIEGVTIGLPRPNPVTDMAGLPLELDRPMTVEVRILDALGRRNGETMILHLPAGPQSLQLDCSGLVPGVYYVQLRSGDWSVVRSIVRGQ